MLFCWRRRRREWCSAQTQKRKCHGKGILLFGWCYYKYKNIRRSSYNSISHSDTTSIFIVISDQAKCQMELIFGRFFFTFETKRCHECRSVNARLVLKFLIIILGGRQIISERLLFVNLSIDWWWCESIAANHSWTQHPADETESVLYIGVNWRNYSSK